MKNKGITLVALVITIIILLILAGISISALTNQGLFKQAQNAKNLTEEKAAEENEILTNYLEQMNAIIGGQVTESVPDGAVVTPVNDITTWLKTAGISKQYSYTTIEQVIANSTCTKSLMNNENAMKYLARSTEFANAICASETTMTYLGQSAYVDDTVLNSDLWVNKVATSPYYELVLKPVNLTVGSTYTLGGNAKTGGSATPQAQVLAISGTKVLMQSKGLWGGTWPGSGELSSTAATYFGDLKNAISNVYLPQGSSENTETVYWNGSQTNAYASTVHSILTAVANSYSTFGAGNKCAWLGTPYNSGGAYDVYYDGSLGASGTYNSFVCAPAFTIDLRLIKLNGSTIESLEFVKITV